MWVEICHQRLKLTTNVNFTSVKEVFIILGYKTSYMKIGSLCVHPLNLSAAELNYVGYKSAILSQNYNRKLS